ncbi:hypothetical protein BDV19DRAFT_213661 [Aspergillus venezuelensis]
MDASNVLQLPFISVRKQSEAKGEYPQKKVSHRQEIEKHWWQSCCDWLSDEHIAGEEVTSMDGPCLQPGQDSTGRRIESRKYEVRCKAIQNDADVVSVRAEGPSRLGRYIHVDLWSASVSHEGKLQNAWNRAKDGTNENVRRFFFPVIHHNWRWEVRGRSTTTPAETRYEGHVEDGELSQRLTL